MRTFFYVIFKKFSFRFEQNALFKRDKSEREKDLCSYLMVGEEVNSMEQSSSYDEKTVMHQFDRKCKLALKGEIVDYCYRSGFMQVSVVTVPSGNVREGSF